MADFWIAQSVPGMFTPRHVLDLPDAEHIHLTRRADGGWDAVPMRRKARDHLAKCDIWWGSACVCGAPWLWVDAPVQGDDRG